MNNLVPFLLRRDRLARLVVGCAALATFLGLAAPLHAQKSPKDNPQVLVTMREAGFGVSTEFALRVVEFYAWNWSNNTGSYVFAQAWNTQTTTGWTHGGTVNMMLKPGQNYQIGLFGWWNYGELKISAPPGYRVLIDDAAKTTVRTPGDDGGGYGLHLFTLRILPEDGSSSLPAGYAMPPILSDMIWAIGAGTTNNGVPVGAVRWQQGTLSQDLLDPHSLLAPEVNSNEFNTAYHSDGALIELTSPQFVLHVRRYTNGYGIEIYNPGAYVTDHHGDSVDGPYTYSESPYREYRISNPDSSWLNRVQIDQINRDNEGSITGTETWMLSKSGSTLTMSSGGGARQLSLASSINGSGDREETVLIQDGSSNVATKLLRTYHTYAWGEELDREVADPDSGGLQLTSVYTYYTSSSSGGYGRLKSVTRPDNSWETYIYDDTSAGFGDLIGIYRSWQDNSTTLTSASASNSLATLYTYTMERDVFNDTLSAVETKINGTTTAKTTTSTSFGSTAPNGQPIRTETLTQDISASASLVTVRKVYHHSASLNFAGRLYSQTNPDGTRMSTVRYKPVNDWMEYRFSGFATSVAGSQLVNSVDGQGMEPVYLVPYRSTVELLTFNPAGQVWVDNRYVFTGATSGVPSLEMIGEDIFSYAMGQVSGHSSTFNNSSESTTYYNNHPLYQGADDFTTNYFNRGSMGEVLDMQRVSVAATSEYPAQAQRYTHYRYDAAGRVILEKVSTDSNVSNNPATSVATARTYNKAGLLTDEYAESTAGNFHTAYTYTNGGLTVTQTLPGGATRISDAWPDGSPRSVTGTAVVATYTTRELSSASGESGFLKTTVYTLGSVANPGAISSPTSAVRWTRTVTDRAGRTVRTETPASGSGTFTKAFIYNATTGRLEKTTETNLADTLTEYDDAAGTVRTGLDVDANGSLTKGSPYTDRISETETIYEKDGSNAWWLKTISRMYVPGSATPVTQGTAKQRLTGFATGVRAQSVATDLFGNATTTTVTVDRDDRLTTTTVDRSDSSYDEVSVTRNGVLQKKVSAQGLTTRLYYDGIDRLLKQTDPRSDTSTTARIGYVSKSSRVDWQDDSAANRTSFTYDSAGRLASTTNALGKTSYQSYNTRGQVTRSWGETTYPVEYGFDDYGQQTTMSTFRGGTGWTGSTWPSSPGTADTTTWAYEASTGLLLSKTDADSKAVSYTYNARGQLAVRTWSRTVSGSPLTTTYSYDSATAEQTGIDYSDSTPDLTYTYNRLGQTATVADGTGTRTFAYSATNTTLTSETFPSYFGSRVLSRKYDTTTTGALGRNVGYTLSGASGSGTDQDLSYGYDSSARFNTVTVASGPSFTYAFASNSNLIGSITETTAGTAWSETMAYESTRNLLASITGKYGSTAKAAFAYAHDELGRRTSVIQTGEIFARYSGAGLINTYGYNDRSELTSGQSFHGTSLSDLSFPVAGRGFGYAFDNIGNRTSSTVLGTDASDVRTTTYTSNKLNQVTVRDAPGSTDVNGLAPNNSTVQVNSTAAVRQGDYFFLNVAAGSRPLWQALTTTSSIGSLSTPRFSFVPAANEAIAYDADGNITSDGRWNYTWDAENRLKSMETASPSVFTSGGTQYARRIDFAYDYLGRRVEKYVRAYNGSAFITDVAKTRFVYNGWNVVAEYNALSSNALLRTNAWGLDISGNLTDGGGVGGLLAIRDLPSSSYHLPLYDANGNVAALFDKSNGTVTAAYEYTPFGETLRATGTYATANNFRFSTKYADAETNLLYYGYRYYDAKMGRFIGRDPSGEKGGLNLYGFCRNNAVNSWDYLGLDQMFDFVEAYNIELRNGSQRTVEEIMGMIDCSDLNADELRAMGYVNLADAPRSDYATGATSFDRMDSDDALARMAALKDRSDPYFAAGGTTALGRLGTAIAGGLSQIGNAITVGVATLSTLASSLNLVGSDPTAPNNAGTLQLPGLIGTATVARANAYLADVTVDPNATPFAKAFAWVSGIVTSMWTPNTAPQTLAIVVGGVSTANGSRPANLSPQGAGRTGALREALRQNGVPTSQQPSRVLPNVDLRGNPQPGRIYEYEVPAPGSGTQTVRIRDDAGGHNYGPNNLQNRGPHFNDEAGRHYDYLRR